MRSHDEWLIVDTETSGLSDPWCIEIGAQRMRGWEPDGEPFRALLNHDVPIEPAAEAVHGYSRGYLRLHGSDPQASHAAFHAYAGTRPMVAHNLAFDWDRVLVPETIRLGLPTPGSRGLCTLCLSRRLLPEVSCYRLEAIAEHFSRSVSPSHQALADVRTLVELSRTTFRERLDAAGIRGFPAVADFSRRTPVCRCLEEISGAVSETPAWYTLDADDRTLGPYRLRQLIALTVGQPCYVWRAGMPDWTVSSDLPEFAGTTPSKALRKSRASRRAKAPSPIPATQDDKATAQHVQAATRELLALCRGIMADDCLNNREIAALAEWLTACPCTTVYPISLIADHVENVCADGIVTTVERSELMDTILAFLRDPDSNTTPNSGR